MRKRCLYTTRQIDLVVGEQLRITAGRRTVFVYRNRRGLHISKGGYAHRLKKSRPKGRAWSNLLKLY